MVRPLLFYDWVFTIIVTRLLGTYQTHTLHYTCLFSSHVSSTYTIPASRNHAIGYNVSKF
jgi:hypothetical protein